MSNKNQGRKDDDGKLRFDLLPPDGIRELVAVYTFGAKLYGDRNWEQGINYSRLLAAAKRHINAYEHHLTFDEESNLHHLAHAVWELMSIMCYDLRGMGDQFNDLPLIISSDVRAN